VARICSIWARRFLLARPKVRSRASGSGPMVDMREWIAVTCSGMGLGHLAFAFDACLVAVFFAVGVSVASVWVVWVPSGFWKSGRR